MKESPDMMQKQCETKSAVLCDKCRSRIPAGDDREHYGKVLCEDCYMDALSPARTCDPWAVHSAKKLGDLPGGLQTNPLQDRILSILSETGGIEPPGLLARLGIKPDELDREIAALRHMEKLRAELREGRKYIVLW